MIPALHHTPVLVLGHGISGQAMARWCVRQGAVVTVADDRDDPALRAELQASLSALAGHAAAGVSAGVSVERWPAPQVLCAALGAELLGQQPWGLVCKSPGLSPVQLQAVTDWAGAHGVPVVGELALFAHGLRQLHAGFTLPKVLAITGTNGKTTTTALTGQLLSRCGWRVAVAGNIGPALLDVLAAAQDAAHAPAHTPVEGHGPSTPAVTEAQVAPGGQEARPNATAEAASPVDGDAEVLKNSESNEAFPLDLIEELAIDREIKPAEHPGLPQVWVLELSSFQLDGVAWGPEGFEPTAATVLNISQDHLDWHGSMAHYTAAKHRVFGQQGLRVLNRDDAATLTARPAAPATPTKPARGKASTPHATAQFTATSASIAHSTGAAHPANGAPLLPAPAWVSFGTDVPRRPGDWGLDVVNGMAWLVRAVAADETRASRRGPQPETELVLQRLMPAEALRIRGRHNAANALAALALATAAGAPLAPMLHGLREYRGEPHRVESVAIIDGVEFFDDSKGTNVGATLAAIRGLGAERRLVMVMGGDGKGQDFSPLVAAVRAHVQAVALIGRDGPALRAVLATTGVPLHDAPDLPAAVRWAAAQAQSGEAVVLSPACSSLDMFRHYGHRAQVFCDAVAELAAEQGTPGVGA